MYPLAGFNGASLAMCPLVGPAPEAKGYVSKGRRFISDAPFNEFFEPLAHRLPKICGGIFPVVSLWNFFGKSSVSVDLSHSWFCLPCRSTLSRLRKVQNGASLAMHLLGGFP